MGSPKKAARKPAKKKKALNPTPTPERLADLQLANRAMSKQEADQPLTARERAALRRVSKLFVAAREREAYRAIPKRLWVSWSGRQNAQLNDQALRHGLPLVGKTINLERLAPAIHELLAKREASAGKQKRASKALELIRREELLLKRMERLARQRVLLERQSVHDTFIVVAEILRKGGAAVLDQFGDEAHAIVDEAIEESVRLDNSLSADDPTEDTND